MATFTGQREREGEQSLGREPEDKGKHYLILFHSNNLALSLKKPRDLTPTPSSCTLSATIRYTQECSVLKPVPLRKQIQAVQPETNRAWGVPISTQL